MKYIDEYRDVDAVNQLVAKIHKITKNRWKIMEVCGGQTHSIVKNGLLDVLPKEITIIHGPGCPVCVTSQSLIDQAIDIALKPNVIFCSYGDMLRVPGKSTSLLEAKANGADIRILYSPLEAVKIAQENPNKEVVFFAVGFETTAPANALSVQHASKLQLKNYSILPAHVLVPPAISAIMEDEMTSVDAFLAAGHVCTIMGTSEYLPLAEKYKVPIVITGFEPVDILQGICMAVSQLENHQHIVENQYKRIVPEEGNLMAQKVIEDVFVVSGRNWRGIGPIPRSGYSVNPKYADYDAFVKFNIQYEDDTFSNGCISGDIMKGIKKPKECPFFGKECNPQNPMGAPMVSSEGACAAYYNFSNL